MDNKVFKKPTIAFGRKVPTVANKENNNRSAGPAVANQTPRKHNCVTTGLSRTVSVSSDESKPNVGSKISQSHTVDLVLWEAKARRIMRELCASNGLDIEKFVSDDGKKKIGTTVKAPVLARGPSSTAQSGMRLLPTLKALDALLTEQYFPPMEMLDLLKPLTESFFVKRCANYWHLFAKAAMMAENFGFAVELLDRGVKCGAEPLMEMQRAYSSICHRLVAKVHPISNGPVLQETQIIVNNEENLEGANSQIGPSADNSLMNHTIGLADGENMEAVENTETEEGVETDKTSDAPPTVDHAEPQDYQMNQGQEPISNDQSEGDHSAEIPIPVPTLVVDEEVEILTNGQEGEAHPDGGDINAMDQSIQNPADGSISVANSQMDESVTVNAISLQSPGLHDISAQNITQNTDGHNEEANGHSDISNGHNEEADGRSDISNDHNDENDIPNEPTNGDLAAASADPHNGTGNGSSLDELPEFPSKTPRRHGNKKQELDPSVVFKSSATKFLVVENKSAKKQKGANAKAYHVTPVRRSTRKAGGFDKWLTYRSTNTSETPPDTPGFDHKTATFVKNPYLVSDEYDSD